MLPQYYAVIFTSIKKDNDEGYPSMAKRMVELAHQQPGFLGVESARNEIGITVSYWESLKAIEQWKNNSAHLIAQEIGKTKWYESYKVRICQVVMSYEF